MTRFKIEFTISFFAEEENEQKGECFMNAEDKKSIEQTAFVMLSEQFIKGKLIMKGLVITNVEEAMQLEGGAAGETIKMGFKTNDDVVEN